MSKADLKSNHEHLSRKIKACKTLDDLKRADTSLERCYTAGVITVSSFRQLYNMILDRGIKFTLA